MRDLDQIAQVEGIGEPGNFGHPRIAEARRPIAEAALRHGKFAGTVASCETLVATVAMGYRFIKVGADILARGEYFCRIACPSRLDIRGILRRMEMENHDGADRRLRETGRELLPCPSCPGRPCERACLRSRFAGSPVPIVENLAWLSGRRGPGS